jgi:hypothetical protein
MPKQIKVRRIYYNVTRQTWSNVEFDKEDCDENDSNNDAIAQATKLIRAGRPFVFVPYDPVPARPFEAVSDANLVYDYACQYDRIKRFEMGSESDEHALVEMRKELRHRGYRVSGSQAYR